MSQKWNLQDIRPARPDRMSQDKTDPLRRKSPNTSPYRTDAVHSAQTNESSRGNDDDMGVLDVVDGNRARRKRTIIAIIFAILLLSLAFLANVLMGGAKVTIYPKFKDVAVQAVFTGKSVPSAGDLGYELLTLEATGERQISASGSEKVSERALGKIFIYNTDTKVVQRLIKNTRFESPEGLIFRIKESVEIPSATTDTKGTLIPGVISADVFADGTGAQYNIEPARFTVPGLKDTEQYKTVYGESTIAMTGGFEGERYILDEAELETKKQELHLELRNGLLQRLKSERPAGFTLFENAITFNFESQPSTSYGDSLATIKEKAYLHVPLFKETEFAKYLAESTIAGYEGEVVKVIEPEKLQFEYTLATTSQSDISKTSELEFLLKGSSRIVWEFDELKLRKDLQGISKSALGTVLTGYPSIDRAEAVVRPFWVKDFPENGNDILMTTILENEKDSASIIENE